jgi:hypothetical protein
LAKPGSEVFKHQIGVRPFGCTHHATHRLEASPSGGCRARQAGWRHRPCFAPKCHPSRPHGETVITAFQDASDYTAFELAITRDYDPQTAVERELGLRLVDLLWRLRSTTAIESGLFNMQASPQPHFNEPELEPRGQNPDEDPSKSKQTEMQGTKVVPLVKTRIGLLPPFAEDPCAEFGLLRQSFVALSHLPTCPLEPI